MDTTTAALPATVQRVTPPGEYAAPARIGWRDIDWAEHQRDEIVLGRRLHLIDIGDGPDTVLLIQYPDRIPPDIAHRLLNAVGTPAARATLRLGFGYDFTPALQAVRCRTLVVGGLRDTIAPPADLLQFASSGPVENVILLQDTGHWPMIEHTDVFNDTVTQFLWNR